MKQTVLLLDDDSIALLIGKKALSDAGYNVISLPDATHRKAKGRKIMKTKSITKRISIIVVVAGMTLSGIWQLLRTEYTFTLTENTFADSNLKTEQIQPITGRITVSGTHDTDVTFTDVETGEQYYIGYITHGLSTSTALKKGRWYHVHGAGDLTIYMIRIRNEEP